MTIPTRYVRTAERWSVGRMLSLLAEIGRGALNVAQARQTHGLTTAELDAWITAFAAYGAPAARAPITETSSPEGYAGFESVAMCIAGTDPSPRPANLRFLERRTPWFHLSLRGYSACRTEPSARET